MEFNLAACFLQSGYFRNGLGHLFNFQFVDGLLQEIELQVHSVDFFKNKLVFVHVYHLISLILLLPEAVDRSLLLLFLADSVLQLLKETLGGGVVGLKFLLEAVNLESDFVVVLIYAREHLLK